MYKEVRVSMREELHDFSHGALLPVFKPIRVGHGSRRDVL